MPPPAGPPARASPASSSPSSQRRTCCLQLVQPSVSEAEAAASRWGSVDSPTPTSNLAKGAGRQEAVPALQPFISCTASAGPCSFWLSCQSCILLQGGCLPRPAAGGDCGRPRDPHWHWPPLPAEGQLASPGDQGLERRGPAGGRAAHGTLPFRRRRPPPCIRVGAPAEGFAADPRLPPVRADGVP